MSPAVWIGAYYLFFFGALGIFLPFFTLWMTAHGLSPTAATRVVALTPLMSLVSPPLVGLWADARRLRGWLLRIGSLSTWLAFSGFFFAEARWQLVATTAVFAFCRAPLTPLIDATALDQTRRDGSSYGRLRLWGSLGFLVAVVGAGALSQRLGLPILISATALFLLLSALCAFALPAPPPEAHREVVGAWLHLLGSVEWWIFFAAVMLGYMATAAYDSGFSLHLTRLGFDRGFVGIAWAIGVAAEIGVLAVSGRLIERVGAPRLFALSLATAVVRWSLLARVTSATAILCLQPLHGITFGLFWVSAVTLVRARGHAAPTAAQGLFAAALGSGSVVGMNVAGALLESGGGRALYSAAALVAAAGTACAAWYARRAPRTM